MRSLNDLGIVTEAPVELVNWTDEEGSRFGHSLMGSGVWSGVYPLEKAYALTDLEGVTVRTALDGIGYRRAGAGGGVSGRRLFRAAYRAGADPGARGKADRHRHRRAGAGLVRRGGDRPGQRMPAPRRPRRARTRWSCAARIIDLVDRMMRARGEDGRGTVGQLRGAAEQPQRGAGRGAVLGRVPPPRRTPRSIAWTRNSRARPGVIARDCGVTLELTDAVQHPGAAVRSRLRRAGAAGRGEARAIRAREIVSGAGHDAVYVARHVPTAMIFTPCKDGLSHNEAESIQPEEAEAGCQVLFEAVLARANRTL